MPSTVLAELDDAVEAAASSLDGALEAAGVDGDALLAKAGPLGDLLDRAGVPEDLRPLAVAAALAALLLLLLCALCCCCCRRRSGYYDPLLPKHVVRSDDGRPCRASAYCAMANDVVVVNGGGGRTAGCGPSKVLADGGSTMSSSIGVAPPMPVQPPSWAQPRPPVVVRSPEESKSNAVASADVEGGRGGGWGDLDDMPETLTVARHEYPTSRRGANLDKYFEEELTTRTLRAQRGRPPNDQNAPPNRRNPTGGGNAPRGGGGRRR